MGVSEGDGDLAKRICSLYMSRKSLGSIHNVGRPVVGSRHDHALVVTPASVIFFLSASSRMRMTPKTRPVSASWSAEGRPASIRHSRFSIEALSSALSCSPSSYIRGSDSAWSNHKLDSYPPSAEGKSP